MQSLTDVLAVRLCLLLQSTHEPSRLPRSDNRATRRDRFRPSLRPSLRTAAILHSGHGHLERAEELRFPGHMLRLLAHLPIHPLPCGPCGPCGWR